MVDALKKWATSMLALLISAICGAVAIDLITDPVWGGFLQNVVTLFSVGLGAAFATMGVLAFIGVFAVWVPTPSPNTEG